MAEPVPSGEWTDDEWLRAMREFDPDANPADVAAAVGRWREEGRADDGSRS